MVDFNKARKSAETKEEKKYIPIPQNPIIMETPPPVEKVLPEEDYYSAVLIGIHYLGKHKGQFGVKEKIQMTFEIDSRIPEGNPRAGERFVISKKFNLSIHDKSSLVIFLSAWFAKPAKKLSKDLDNVDLMGIYSMVAYLQVGKFIYQENEYSSIEAIFPLPQDKNGKYTVAQPIEIENTDFQLNPPDWIRNLMIKGGVEGVQLLNPDNAEDNSDDDEESDNVEQVAPPETPIQKAPPKQQTATQVPNNKPKSINEIFGKRT